MTLCAIPSRQTVAGESHDHDPCWPSSSFPINPPSVPALRAADQGVASSLESVLSDNTHRVYGTQWRIFTGWCDEMGLTSLPAEPLTVARYLAARAELRRQHRHHASRHVGHFESPRVGQAGIARPGSGRARLFEGMGKTPLRNPSARPAPSPPTFSP